MDKSAVTNFGSKNFHSRLLQTIQQLDDFLDVTLWVDSKTIQAHRIILAAGSPVLHQVFKRHEATDKTPISMYRRKKKRLQTFSQIYKTITF